MYGDLDPIAGRRSTQMARKMIPKLDALTRAVKLQSRKLNIAVFSLREKDKHYFVKLVDTYSNLLS
ncbi:MAG: hypothetical protein ACE5GD_09105 [Candidatus Geothermarchaeales archaeon]